MVLNFLLYSCLPPYFIVQSTVKSINVEDMEMESFERKCMWDPPVMEMLGFVCSGCCCRHHALRGKSEIGISPITPETIEFVSFGV